MRIGRKVMVGAAAAAVLVGGFVVATIWPQAREPFATLATHIVSLAALFIVGHTVTDVAAVVKGKGEGQPLP
jgi:hypothetical protein